MTLTFPYNYRQVRREKQAVLGWSDRQGQWGDMSGMEHKINKTGLKWGHLRHVYIRKEVPARHLEKSHKPFLESLRTRVHF